jgi:predicted amidohydrolase
MKKLRIALLQMTACGNDQAANQAKGEAFCRQARQMGADISLFPEMWNIGYVCEGLKAPDSGDLFYAPEQIALGKRPYQHTPEEREARPRWQAQAIDRDSPFVVHYQRLARELDMAIALTYLERWPDAPRNSVSLIDRHGGLRMTYAKVHTCDFDEPEGSLTPGDDFFVSALDTAQGAVQIGAMICYDREFPESARILMLKGAEIILIPNDCDWEINRHCQLRARAYENMVGIAMTNSAGARFGHSVAFDGMAFDEKGSRDMLIVEAGEDEGIYLADFDLDRLRDYRQRETWGNAFRRPHRYSLLTSTDVQPPFVRVADDGTPFDRTER